MACRALPSKLMYGLRREVISAPLVGSRESLADQTPARSRNSAVRRHDAVPPSDRVDVVRARGVAPWPPLS